MQNNLASHFYVALNNFLPYDFGYDKNIIDKAYLLEMSA